MKIKLNGINGIQLFFIGWLSLLNGWVIGRRPICRHWIPFHSFQTKEFHFINVAHSSSLCSAQPALTSLLSFNQTTLLFFNQFTMKEEQRDWIVCLLLGSQPITKHSAIKEMKFLYGGGKRRAINQFNHLLRMKKATQAKATPIQQTFVGLLNGIAFFAHSH